VAAKHLTLLFSLLGELRRVTWDRGAFVVGTVAKQMSFTPAAQPTESACLSSPSLLLPPSPLLFSLQHMSMASPESPSCKGAWSEAQSWPAWSPEQRRANERGGPSTQSLW
jgi:hypothetical protein